jgi:predicted DNA-binding protein (MmcQ/YjbR family)
VSASSADSRLQQVTTICLDLPEAACEANGQHASTKVRGKTFAYFLDDHHGDGRVALTCRVAPELQEALLASNEDRFFKPAYLGARGWIGVRLDLGPVDWAEIADINADSYRLAAPKRLAAELDR